MAVGVKEDHNEEGGDPSETGTADDFSGVFGNPGDEAGLAQRRGERHEAAHPEHGVVGPFFRKNVLPRENFGNQHDCDGEHGDRSCAQMRPAARSPEHETHDEDKGKHLFIL